MRMSSFSPLPSQKLAHHLNKEVFGKCRLSQILLFLVTLFVLGTQACTINQARSSRSDRQGSGSGFLAARARAATLSATPPTSSGAKPTPILPVQEIRNIQARLLELGYAEAGRADGIFSPQTSAALRHFQYLNQLPINGDANDITRKALFDPSAAGFLLPLPFPGKALKMDLTQPLCDEHVLQDRLAVLKFLEPSEEEFASGIFGRKTDAAVRKFQKANGLTVNGIVDIKTWGALFNPWVVDANGHRALPPPAKADSWETTIYAVAPSPYALVYDGKRIWTAHSSGPGFTQNFVMAIDPSAGPLQTSVPVSAGVCGSENNRIEVTTFARGNLWFYLPEVTSDEIQTMSAAPMPAVQNLSPESGITGKPVYFAACEEGFCMPAPALGFDGSRLWAAAGDRIWPLDAASGKPGKPIQVGWLAHGDVISDKRCLWVAGEAGLFSFLPGGGACPSGTDAYALPNGPLAFDGKRIWAADSDSGIIVSLEVKTGKIGEPLSTGSQPSALAFDGKRLWVANRGDNTIQGFDISNGAFGNAVPVGEQPSDLLFDGKRLWVANAGSNTIQYFDPQVIFTPAFLPTITPTPTITPDPTRPELTRNLFLKTPNLTGDDVRVVQERLFTLGYIEVGVPDGIFGPLTDRAVRRFQSDKGLVVDGIVGPMTWKALFE